MGDKTILEITELSKGKVAIFEESATDFPAVSKLFKKTFYKSLPPKYFQWKYREDFLGKLFCVGAKALKTDLLIGHVAAVPVSGRISGRECIFFQFVDAMVDDEWRGGNLLTKMIYHLESIIKLNKKCNFCYVFPGPVSLQIGKKYNWLHPIEEIEDLYFERPSITCKMKSWTVKLETARLDPLICEKINEKCLEDFSTSLVRDWDFVEWRFYNHPINQYMSFVTKFCGKLVGWCFFLKENGKYRLIDYWIPKGFLPYFFAKIAVQNNVVLWIPRYLRTRTGCSNITNKSTPITLGIIKTIKTNKQPLHIPSNFFYTMADIDIY